MSEVLTPRVECQELSEKYGRFVAEPLERGFGTTLGNAMRRVLLSSLPGAAVTWVKIEGVQHEFSVLPHMKEDVVEFILNVKALRLRPLSSASGRMTLEARGEGGIVAGDINPSADFEIVNPDLHLATLDSSDAELNVEFNVEQGKGYVPAGHSDGLPIGVIPVDAIFSPTRKVNYTVEHTRVGQVTSFERLILEVWTDGTISPIDAVSQAARILVEKAHLFYDLAYREEWGVEKAGVALQAEQYNVPIEQLGLSVRTFNCLKRAGITKVGELLERSDEDLLKIKNLGQKALEEVRTQLREHGFAVEEEAPAEEAPPEEEGSEEEIE
ncbi:MAG: DNA-directed RNA polymerase subunit alpha [Chloroflexota bacterium]|nr:DNA-directed RNA polymerase subunit alpha [Chloroflexota bacterium]